jgi:formylglycine-generating enzyme required for sulfatase activity
MRRIPAGPFVQGDVLGTENLAQIKTFQNSSDEPYREVILDDYWIDRFPVTHGQFRDFLQEGLKQKMVRVEGLGVWGEFEGSWVPFYYFRSYEELIRDRLSLVNARRPTFLHWISWDPDQRRFEVKPGKEKTPVVDVSWFGASAYARFHGKQLPTEAQWEKAARGTDRRIYPWGDNAPTAYHANLNYSRGYAPLPVGSFSPHADSPYGVSDMVSGLFEWTGDWFNADYYRDNEAPTPHRNPTGTFWGRAHTIRSLPYALFHPGNTVERDEAVSFRYHWRFEFFVGDIFANSETTFRTVIAPPRDEEYESEF